MRVPIKLQDSDNGVEFKEFNDQISGGDLSYIAYLAGLNLASLDSDSPSRLGVDVSTSGNRLVGSLTDTILDNPVGTPETNSYTGVRTDFLSTTSVTSVVKQKIGQENTSNNNDYRNLVYFTKNNGQSEIHEFNSTDTDEFTDELNKHIHSNDYPGTYVMGVSAPSADYTLELPNVTTDTRQDGTSITTNIYKRTSMAAPDKSLPFAIKRSSGQTGSYQGLQAMSDNQVKETFGLLLRNKITSDNDRVGRYLILSSAESTPTASGYSGTWRTQGIATDTRQQVISGNYARTRTSSYQEQYLTQYEGNYARTRTSNYVVNSQTRSSSQYQLGGIDAYSSVRTSTYSPSFIGNFIGDYARTSTRHSTRLAWQHQGYQSNFIGNFDTNFTRLIAYAGAYTRESSRTSTGSLHDSGTLTFEGNFSRTLFGTQVVSYSKLFAADYVGNYIGDYGRTSTQLSEFARQRTQDFTGGYFRLDTFSGDFVGNFIGESITTSTRASEAYFSRGFTGNYSRNYEGNYIGDYGRTSTRNSLNSSFSRGFTGDFHGDFHGDYLGDFTGNFEGNYQHGHRDYHYRVGERYFDWANYNRTSTRNSTRYSTRDSNRTSTRGSVAYYTGDFAGNFAGNYAGIYVGNYARAFTRSSTGVYLGQGGIGQPYTRDFTGNYEGNYTRKYIANYEGNYSRNFEGNYVEQYIGQFIGNYNRSFQGDYVGREVSGGQALLETYTLWVRIS
jgi:hypothetical protein